MDPIDDSHATARSELELFQFLSEHSLDGQVVLDEGGIIRHANAAAGRLLGRTASELQGTPWSEHVDFETARLVAMACEREERLEEVELRCINRRRRVAEIRARTVSFRGERHCFLSIRDVTEREDSRRREHVEHAVAAAVALSKSVEEAEQRLIDEFVDGFGLYVAELWVPEADGLAPALQRFGEDAPQAELWRRASARAERGAHTGLLWKMWTLQRPVWVSDLRAEPALHRREAANAIGLRTGFGLPVGSGDERLGVFAFFTRDAIAADADLLHLLTAVQRSFEQFLRRIKSEQELWLRQRAIDQAREGIVIADARRADLPIVYVNRGFERLTGYTFEEVRGRNCRLLQGPASDPDVVARLRAAIAERREAQVVLLNYDKSGRSFWNDLQVAPVRDDEGNVTHFCGILHDVTVLKSTEERLRQMGAAAEASNEAKSMFLANVSHDIRTPLSAVLGFCDILLERIDDPSAVRDLRAIRRNGAYLVELVDDILDLSRIEAGKLRMQMTSFTLAELILDIDALMQVRALERGLPLSFEFARPVPQQLRTDRVRVRQILVNLIGNALKYTGSGAVRVVIDYVQPGAERFLQFRVIDTGPGIAECDFERIFEPFRQLPGAAQSAQRGSGLGLSIARRLATQLGGEIRVESRVGSGSTFTLSIPVESAEGELLAQPSLLARELGGARASSIEGLIVGCRALVVDDVEDVRQIAAHFLERSGALVEFASSGEQALERIESAAARDVAYDVVLLDMLMPGLGGDEVASRLRARGFDRPILAVTASAVKEQRERWLRAGCDEVISKPIDGLGLVQAVAGHLQRRVRARRRNEAGTASDQAPPLVLVVEDDLDAGDSMRRLLERHGAWVQVARSGREALDCFRRWRPELVLMDLNLVDIDGFTLVGALIAQQRGRPPLYVAVSGSAEAEDRVRSERAGFESCLLKPVDPRRLYALCDRVVSERPPDGAAGE
jgi:PAS domain S-box-containing protein